MSKIQILPDQVANQIAAGEVVERPVAVIKELVENSIDAGATKIEIEFRQGGKAYMRVEDDGNGMDEEDALLCLERHATSKIQTADDLNRLYSFGFRGEALPSIASVSRFTLQTRPKEQQSGVEILINGGKLIHKRECGIPPGTRIEVANLFNSVPARRKFLKADATESAHIIQLTRLFAIAHPEISFTLQEGSRVVFRSPVCKDLKDRIAEIYNAEIANGLIPIIAERYGYKIQGLIGKPGIGRATRQEMITLVNNRPVDSKTLNFAIVEAYHTFITKGRYPIAFLFVEMNPAEMDINVHPSKKEIRFHNEGKIRNLVIESILGVLDSKAPISSTEETKSIPEPAVNFAPNTNSQALESVSTAAAKFSPSPPIKNLQADKETVSCGDTSTEADVDQSARIYPKKTQDLEKPFPWSFVGIIQKQVALFEEKNGLIALHCKSAEERIAYEKIELYLQSENKSSQKLLLPIPLDLDPLSSQTLKEINNHLSEIGFSVDEFGRNFYRLDAIPSWMEPEDAKWFVLDVIDYAKEQGQVSKNKKITDDIFKKLATNNATRTKKNITPGEAIQIAKSLLSCKVIHTSPSGKPTYLELPKSFFEKKFGRVV